MMNMLSLLMAIEVLMLCKFGDLMCNEGLVLGWEGECVSCIGYMHPFFHNVWVTHNCRGPDTMRKRIHISDL